MNLERPPVLDQTRILFLNRRKLALTTISSINSLSLSVVVVVGDIVVPAAFGNSIRCRHYRLANTTPSHQTPATLLVGSGHHNLVFFHQARRKLHLLQPARTQQRHLHMRPSKTTPGGSNLRLGFIGIIANPNEDSFFCHSCVFGSTCAALIRHSTELVTMTSEECMNQHAVRCGRASKVFTGFRHLFHSFVKSERSITFPGYKPWLCVWCVKRILKKFAFYRFPIFAADDDIMPARI